MKRIWTDANGAEHPFTDCDPHYEPPLPVGAIRANVPRQTYRDGYDVPLYYYVDEPRTCVQCQRRFVFKAVEQQLWYERLGFPLRSIAVRCLPCRRQRRSAASYREQIGRARAVLIDESRSTTHWLALAEGIVRLHELTGTGKLAEAVGAARRVQLLSRNGASFSNLRREAHYWEGVAHALAGRRNKAIEALETFLEIDEGQQRSRRHLHLHESAHQLLGNLRRGS